MITLNFGVSNFHNVLSRSCNMMVRNPICKGFVAMELTKQIVNDAIIMLLVLDFLILTLRLI